jgi:hypothetical protein
MKTHGSGFQDRCLQPLGHPSIQWSQVVSFDAFGNKGRTVAHLQPPLPQCHVARELMHRPA